VAACIGIGVGDFRITRPAGAPGGDVLLYDTDGRAVASWQCDAEATYAPGYGDRFFWCAFPGLNCVTPVQNRTWGAIKSQYR
jgi:hypothetical protein